MATTRRLHRHSMVAGCLGLAASIALAGCSLSGGNTSSTSKSTLPKVTKASVGASTSTFKTVPISPTAPPTTAQVSTGATDTGGNVVPPDGYTVKPNDTLSGIALALGIPYADLLAANPEIDPKKFLLAGQKLIIPVGVAAPTGTNAPGQTPTPTTTQTATTQSSVQASGQTYTVVAGDYFIGIAKKLGVTLDALLAVNNMNANSLITAGMKLKVPKGGTVPKATATTVTKTTAKATTTTVKK